APGLVSMGRLLVLYGVRTLCVTVALFAAFEAVRSAKLRRGWWLASAVACGLGVLTKGPVAVLLLVPPLWLHRRLTRAPRIAGWRAWLVFAAVVLGVSLPWYVAIAIRSPEFGPYFFWKHNFQRFFMPFDHLKPIWYYAPILVGGLLPGMLLLVGLIRFLLSERTEDVARRTPELGFMLLAGGWCVMFFSLSGSKLPTYVLPACPFLALSLGAYLSGSRWQAPRWSGTVAGVALGILMAAHYFVIPHYARERSPMKRTEEVREYCGDLSIPVVCYPRNLDSVSFYLRRDDLRSYRSKSTPQLLEYLDKQERAVVLTSHRHSLQCLVEMLPPHLRVHGQKPLGLCDMALVERRRPQRPPSAPR